MAVARFSEWRSHGTGTGALLLILAWVLFTAEMVIVRGLASQLSVVQIGFVRLAVQLLAFLPFIIWRPKVLLGTKRLRVHLLRAGCSALVMPIYYFAFAILPFAVVTTVTFTQALFLVVLAGLIAKEKIGRRRWLATAVGFLGVVVIMRPGMATFEPMILFVLVGALIAAFLMLLTRQLGQSESALTIMTYVCLFGTLFLTLPAWFVWRPPDPTAWRLLLLAAVIGTVGQFLFVYAFKCAEASALAPIDYVRLIFAVIVGYWLYNEIPDHWTWIGALIIIGSALTVTRLEQRAERAPES